MSDVQFLVPVGGTTRLYENENNSSESKLICGKSRYNCCLK